MWKSNICFCSSCWDKESLLSTKYPLEWIQQISTPRSWVLKGESCWAICVVSIPSVLKVTEMKKYWWLEEFSETWHTNLFKHFKLYQWVCFKDVRPTCQVKHYAVNKVYMVIILVLALCRPCGLLCLCGGLLPGVQLLPGLYLRGGHRAVQGCWLQQWRLVQWWFWQLCALCILEGDLDLDVVDNVKKVEQAVLRGLQVATKEVMILQGDQGLEAETVVKTPVKKWW